MDIDSLCQRLGLPNPWMQSFERLPSDHHGWFPLAKQRQLEELLGRDARYGVVIELGSWLGQSTRWWASRTELVIAIDHWRGSEENRHDPRLGQLYEQFLSNCYDLRRRILPVRMPTDRAARLAFPKADIVFVDADHAQSAVHRDLKLYEPHLRSGGMICGDDWMWSDETGAHSVQNAVTTFSRERPETEIRVAGNIWLCQQPNHQTFNATTSFR